MSRSIVMIIAIFHRKNYEGDWLTTYKFYGGSYLKSFDFFLKRFAQLCRAFKFCLKWSGFLIMMLQTFFENFNKKREREKSLNMFKHLYKLKLFISPSTFYRVLIFHIDESKNSFTKQTEKNDWCKFGILLMWIWN